MLFAQDKLLLSHQLSHELRWGRFANTKGGAGNNVSCDQHLEHMDKFLKQCLSSVSPSIKSVLLLA